MSAQQQQQQQPVLLSEKKKNKVKKEMTPERMARRQARREARRQARRQARLADSPRPTQGMKRKDPASGQENDRPVKMVRFHLDNNDVFVSPPSPNYGPDSPNYPPTSPNNPPDSPNYAPESPSYGPTSPTEADPCDPPHYDDMPALELGPAAAPSSSSTEVKQHRPWSPSPDAYIYKPAPQQEYSPPSSPTYPPCLSPEHELDDDDIKQQPVVIPPRAPYIPTDDQYSPFRVMFYQLPSRSIKQHMSPVTTNTLQ